MTAIITTEVARDSRMGLEKFVRFSVSNASSIREKSIATPPFYIHDWKWTCELEHESGSLAVYFTLDFMNESSLWNMECKCYISVKNYVDDEKDEKDTFRTTFNREVDNWGNADFIDLDTLLNEQNGYVKDDVIKFEINVVIEKTTGFRKDPFIDFLDAKNPSFDVALVVENCKIHVGKQILAMHSPVFHTMFYGDFAEKNKAEIELKDVKKEEFLEFLHMIYSLGRKITAETVEYLLKLADRFQIKYILDLCEEFLKDESKLATIEKYALSDQYRLTDLQGHCLRSFTKVKDITNLEQTDGYKALSQAAKCDLLYRIMRIRNE